ncbi:MAG TPA: hypothetical protein VGM31_08775 [Puia sp.]|jgi:hypothetical protein
MGTKFFYGKVCLFSRTGLVYACCTAAAVDLGKTNIHFFNN